MKLVNEFKVLSPYRGKSKFDFFRNIQEDDLLEVSIDLRQPSYYKHKLVIRNITRGEAFGNITFNMASTYFDKMTLIKV